MAQVVAGLPVAVASKAEGEPVAMAMVQPVAVAQPMPVTAYPAAMPVPHADTNHHEDFTLGVGYAPAVPREKWESDLCDCGAAGFGMCCAAFCCPFITAPQLYEKVLGRAGSCAKWCGIIFIFYMMYQVGSTIVRMVPLFEPQDGIQPGEEGWEWSKVQVNTMFLVWTAISAIGSLGTSLTVCTVLMAVRKRIREKDHIPVAVCGGSEDCCCSCCCSCCVTIQIFNHLRMRCDTGYELFSKDGVRTRGYGGDPGV